MEPRRIGRIVCQEPTLDEVLTEPIVRLVMSRDGVTRAELEALFARVRHSRFKETDTISVHQERLNAGAT